MRTNTVRPAFALPDAIWGLATLAVAAILLLAAAGHVRQQQVTASSLSQLRWIAGATASYAADNGDRFWSFSWTAGPTPSAYPDLQFASSDRQAAGMQATDIMRRLSGRDDLPLLSAWLPHVLYSHLPLVDYLGGALPDFKLIAPADRYRLAWARDPAAFDRGEFLPFQPDPTDSNKRWVYSSSYLAPAALWDRSEVPFERVRQAATHSSYIIPSSATFGGALRSDMFHPSQKVIFHDGEQRSLGAGGLYCVDADARAAALLGDDSAGLRAAPQSNPGWNPVVPGSATATQFQYEPRPWEAPTSTGEPGVLVTGRYRWTRGGIYGRDFGGPEIDTGQP